jgi:hypothetical protein
MEPAATCRITVARHIEDLRTPSEADLIVGVEERSRTISQAFSATLLACCAGRCRLRW